MPLSEQRGDGAAIGVDLVNSWDEYDRPPELLSLRWLQRWLEWHGYERLSAQVGEADVERARELRGRLAAAFDAPGADDAVEILNGVVAELGMPPRLVRAGRGWTLRAWPDEDAGLDAAVAQGALGLLEAIRDLGWARFGRCAGAPCRCVFVDRSRNRSRRFCCAMCSDRIAQAAYRRRRRTAPSA
jgi:predicted RNA-binding Zn ribbon-like protein